MLHRCDSTDHASTRRIGLDEPLEIKSASHAIRDSVPGGDLAAALDAAPVDSHGFREISFKLGGDITSRHEDRTRIVLSEDADGRTIACDCGRVYDDELFSTEYPHGQLKSYPFESPVIEVTEADSDRVEREAAELAFRREVAAKVAADSE